VEKEFEILISADILESYQNNFTLESNTELMIDFVRRMSGNRVKANSEIFKQRMQDDPFINCLKPLRICHYLSQIWVVNGRMCIS
jgi:hypothetical protein